MVKIGSSDLDVSRLCLGGNVFGWTADRDTSFAVLDAYVAAGGNFIDTVRLLHVAGPRQLRRRVRDDHRRVDGGPRQPRRRWWSPPRSARCRPGQGCRPRTSPPPCEDSLRRLRTDRIDLYYAHRDDPDTAQEETLDAFDALVRAGKVRALGASNFTAERLRSALEISARDGLASYVALQPHYNLLERASSRPSSPRCWPARAWPACRTTGWPRAS